MLRTLLIALPAALLWPLAADAKDQSLTFLVPANDGYGVADCLPQGGECAYKVANAWCAAQGYHHASSLGLAANGDRGRQSGIVITCDN